MHMQTHTEALALDCFTVTEIREASLADGEILI